VRDRHTVTSSAVPDGRTRSLEWFPYQVTVRRQAMGARPAAAGLHIRAHLALQGSFDTP